MINISFSGATYPYPVEGDTDWGAEATNFAVAVGANALPRAGGLFTLNGADLDLGATYGIKALFHGSRSATPATTGVVRLGNSELVTWRNNANNADLSLTVNSSDQLTFDGVPIGNAVTYTANRVIETNGSGALSASSVTSTTLGYLDATSSIQTQLDTLTSAKVPYSGATGDVNIGAFNLDAANVYVTGLLASGPLDTMTVDGLTVTSNIQANSDTLSVIESHTHSDVAGSGAVFYHARSRGTTASPLVVQNGDVLGTWAMVAYDGTDYGIASQIVTTVDGTPGNNDTPGKLSFQTTAGGASTPTERLSINAAGAVAVAGLTASRALVTNASKELTSSAVTDTQLGYLSTTTSDVQVQIDGKVSDTGDTMTGPLLIQDNDSSYQLSVRNTSAPDESLPLVRLTVNNGTTGTDPSEWTVAGYEATTVNTPAVIARFSQSYDAVYVHAIVTGTTSGGNAVTYEMCSLTDTTGTHVTNIYNRDNITLGTAPTITTSGGFVVVMTGAKAATNIHWHSFVRFHPVDF